MYQFCRWICEILPYKLTLKCKITVRLKMAQYKLFFFHWLLSTNVFFENPHTSPSKAYTITF